MATTQKDRLLAIATPLGEDFLLLNKFKATEEISRLFSCEVELLHEENEEGHEPTEVDPTAIIGKGVTISIKQKDGTSRTLSGIVNSFARGDRTTRFSYYTATIVPHVWILTQNIQSRIFQRKSVADILKEVLEGFEVTYEIQGNFKPRNYCVQYRESDFAFISRLMEEEGFYYYFEHSGGTHKLIIANTAQSHRDTPSKTEIDYFTKATNEDVVVSTIRDLWVDCNLQTGKIALRDYNFQLPTNKLDVQQPSLFNVGDNQKLEHYDFPAGYARKYDGIDQGGGESASDLQEIFEDNRRTVESWMYSLDSKYKVFAGHSDCSSLTAGYRFNLKNHPKNDFNGQYLMTSISHVAEQVPVYVADDDNPEPYKSTFNCIPHGSGAPEFRPERITAIPVIQGAQTATVVGPSGEEIFTDKYGRVKVQFHWDRHGKNDSDSSCWIRVAQTWASKGWGSMFIPRVGMEVVVNFIEGDPDRPIITGCVYNPETMPAYKLPDEKTKSGLKSNSSKGGDGFNEFRIEDAKGKEQIFVHGQKDMDIRVLNDTKETILNDRHMEVHNDQKEEVKKDKHLTVGGDQNEEVTGTVSLTAQNLQEKIKQDYAIEAEMGAHIKGGMNVVVEAGTSLTLKVGGNFININSGGVFIKGTMVMINSGGVAGSGSGANPDSAKPPTEAANADPGSEVRRPEKQRPPEKPEFTSPAALVLVNAAKNGTPFCEICSR